MESHGSENNNLISDALENEINKKTFLKKVILQYYNITFFSKEKTTICLKVNPQVYHEFINTLLDNNFRLYGNVGRMVEALMRIFIDTFKTPKAVQTTLFYCPTINVKQNVEINIARKLELKLVTNDLETILKSLEQKKGNAEFYLSRLREILPKAIRLYEKTNDQKIEELLSKAEKWI